MKYAQLELGTIEAVFNKLGGIEGADRFLRGELKVVEIHVIDCDATPFVPGDWSVENHQLGGKIDWDPSQVVFHLEDEQLDGSVKGHELRKKLEDKKPVLNANILDYLLVNQRLIPDEWEGKNVFFWGTICSSPNGTLHVHFMRWDNWDGCHKWDIRPLDFQWDGNDLAVVLRSSGQVAL